MWKEYIFGTRQFIRSLAQTEGGALREGTQAIFWRLMRVTWPPEKQLF